MLDPSTLFAKVLSALNAAVSGWTLFFLAVAGAIVLYAPIPGEVDLVQFRRDQGGWILAVTIVCGALALAKLVSWAQIRLQHAWQRRAKRRAREEAKARALAHLDTLSRNESDILKRCISRGQRTVDFGDFGDDDDDGDDAIVGAQALSSKGLLEYALPRGLITLESRRGGLGVYTIPTFVWEELQRRRDSFLTVAKPVAKR